MMKYRIAIQYDSVLNCIILNFNWQSNIYVDVLSLMRTFSQVQIMEDVNFFIQTIINSYKNCV